MRLMQVENGDDWTLLDEQAGVLRMISGGVTAWGSRIAGGEGAWALPVNGRLADRARDAIDATCFRRILGAEHLEGGETLAAVLGAPLEGRRSPMLSLAGYMLAGGSARSLRLGPVLVTRDEFPESPSLMRKGVLVSASEILHAMEAEHALRTGDVVILGAPLLTAHQRARLSSSLAELPPQAGGRAADNKPAPRPAI